MRIIVCLHIQVTLCWESNPVTCVRSSDTQVTSCIPSWKLSFFIGADPFASSCCSGSFLSTHAPIFCRRGSPWSCTGMSCVFQLRFCGQRAFWCYLFSPALFSVHSSLHGGFIRKENTSVLRLSRLNSRPRTWRVIFPHVFSNGLAKLLLKHLH